MLARWTEGEVVEHRNKCAVWWEGQRRHPQREPAPCWRLASRDRRRQLGMEFDSGLRMLAEGCYWSSPGGLSLSTPPLLRAGGCALI